MNRYKFCNRCGKKIEFNKTCSCHNYNADKRKYYYSNKEEHRFLNSKIWKNKRSFIIERDGHKCIRCFEKYNKINAKELQVHHIKSRRDYPDLRLEDENLLTLCKTCNLQLGTSNKLDFETDSHLKQHVRDYSL